jgi:hypothetical protein
MNLRKESSLMVIEINLETKEDPAVQLPASKQGVLIGYFQEY